jgi:Predicted metal-dependent hydrolase of the TIM-barrel fold
MLSEIEALGKPLQIHTGIQSSCNADGTPTNAVYNANPTLLINLFREYPSVRFILFHASYPYSREAGVLAKQWPNVYLDLCWMHEINPKAYEDTLSEWLELVPNNKIMAFGGDYGYIEGTYGASRIVRQAVARVIQEKVDKGHWDKEDAEKVAGRILRQNAEAVFKLTQ